MRMIRPTVLFALATLAGCAHDPAPDPVALELSRLNRDGLRREAERIEEELQRSKKRLAQLNLELQRSLATEAELSAELRRQRQRLLELEELLVDAELRAEALRQAENSPTPAPAKRDGTP